jgi:endonuclease YncB( thermonuclease family)
MNAVSRLNSFIIYFTNLPKNIEIVVKNQLELSIRYYLNSLSSEEKYRKFNQVTSQITKHSSSAQSSFQFYNSKEILNGVVKHQVDADTFDVQLKNGKVERVRIAGIDAPEKNTAAGQRAVYSNQKFFSGSAVNSNVTLYSEDKYDRYNRKIARLAFKNNDIAASMVERGDAFNSIATENTTHAEKNLSRQEIELLEMYIRDTAVMELFKLSYDFTAQITSERIKVNSVQQIVDQAIDLAIENTDSALGKSLTNFTKLISMSIYKKFTTQIVKQVNTEVSALVNSMFK